MRGCRVEVDRLTIRYGAVNAVADLSLTVVPGEIVALLGENGAGKTTTLECVTGLRQPTSGAVRVDGFEVGSELTNVKRIVGAQLQETSLHDKITPREALRFFRAVFDHGPSVDELIGRFGLAEKADARFDTLSVGQRQRVGLALAFVNDPKLLVLDEPTAGLDPVSRRGLHDVIRSAKAEGRTILLSTHHIDEAELLCDRIGIIAAGRLVASGTPSELISSTGGRVALAVRTDRSESSIPTDDLNRSLSDLSRRLQETGERLIDLKVVRPSLEDAFLKITKAAQ